MGNLKPGAIYIYEKANGITYARETGAPANERFEIGRDYYKQLNDEYDLWKQIIEESHNNSSLQEALEKCKIIYYLSKKEKSLLWHPV